MARMALSPLCIASLLLAGCAAADAPLWGTPRTIAQAEQSAAPALWVEAGRITAGWIGSDQAGVHQDARIITGDDMGPVIVLPLPPVHPFDQRFFPAASAGTHNLWLDRAENGSLGLYSALLTSQLEVERGPTPLSDHAVRHYTALPQGDGSLLVVWSGGPLAEPGLYQQTMDRAGRPRPAEPLSINGDWPLLAQDGAGQVWLYWLRSGSVHRARIEQGSIEDSREIGTLDLQPGDRFEGLQAGFDTTTRYIFANLTAASGERQSWYSANEAPFIRIGLAESEGYTIIEVPFNSGPVPARQPGSASFASAIMPLSGESSFLPAAAIVDEGLGVLYFRDGIVHGYQQITPAVPVGLPALYTDRDRYLYLTWAQPTPEGYARLQLASRRFSG